MTDFHSPKLPETIPVMVLQGTCLFPHGLLPLFIFEQRYRDMLDHALKHDRMFCVGNVITGVDPETHPDPVHRVTTAGLVRACVTHDDGTSHLMLAGMQRISITGWEQDGPFRIAKIESIDEDGAKTGMAAEKAQEVIDLCGRLDNKGPQLSELLAGHLRGLKCPSAIADVISQNFITDLDLRQTLLETIDIEARLDLISSCLGAQISGESGV